MSKILDVSDHGLEVLKKSAIISNDIYKTRYSLRSSIDQTDEATDSIRVVDHAHAKIHEGNHFYYRQYITLLKAATYDILFVTPNTTRWTHFSRVIDVASSACIFTLYEGVTTSNNGTPLTILNRDRNSNIVNTTLVYHTPTITNVGTNIAQTLIGAGKNIGGSNRDENEAIFKQNTKYLCRITETNINNTEVNILLDWYEHTNYED